MNGLSITLNPPGPWARRLILTNELERLQLRLDSSAIDYLVERTQGTVPQLLQKLNRLVLEKARRESLQREQNMAPAAGDDKQLDQKKPSPPRAKFGSQNSDPFRPFSLGEVKQLLRGHESTKPTIRSITNSVAKEFGVKTRDLLSQSRKQSIVRARGFAMLLCRILLGLSLEEIGKQFGGRDHTTVLHACRKTQGVLQQDAELLLNLKTVLAELGIDERLGAFLESSLEAH